MNLGMGHRCIMGKRHTYCTCFNNRCESECHSIRQEELEGVFVTLLTAVQLSQRVADLAKAMFKNAWGQQSERTREIRTAINARLTEIEKQIATLLDMIGEARNQRSAERYEIRNGELERERLVMSEKLEAKGGPRKSFEEMIELTLRFFSGPCSISKNSPLAQRQAVLKPTFSDRLVYRWNEGFRNLKTSIGCRALE